jgi:hypothetical protein
VNLAAGDLDPQANLRALTPGGSVTAQGRQTRQDNHGDRPCATSVGIGIGIGGSVYADGSGLAAINQASGSGNMQLDAVAGELAAQGLRETTDGSLSSAISARQGATPRKHLFTRRRPAQHGGRRSAMQGYRGVMQLAPPRPTPGKKSHHNDSHSGSSTVTFDKKVELSTDISLKGDPHVQGV